jgi:molybdate transport system ATP-binding protein
VAQLGPPAVVFGRPVTPAVATFVGVETILPGEVVAAEAGLLTVGVGPHRLTTPGALAVGRRVQVCLRPEDVALTVGDGMSASPTSVRNHLPGRIGRVSPRGAVAVALVEIDGGLSLSVLVTSASALELGLAPGRPVVAAIKASAIHLIPREGADAPASPPV